MVDVVFTNKDGSAIAASGDEGDSLLRVAQAAGLPLEGTCEGQMACSTCHVVVAAEWFERLPPACEEEEDMLDFAAGVQPTSRLACQIVLDAKLAGLAVAVPDDSHDMRRI
ncbi:Adrenodoxin-like protein, mitochondrial [Alteripontixanthobacter maritimus]|uniref:Adrenodoxin-like protein, mitochondrial n=1 Tax=Alteripontixanthobacter maritimus TaxID=2161824 RepID=A0A369Q6Q6_9SPHN|nr:2Fe-2S iron-sulfur cluster-binding protein [Alteripontixanthobacter maritimus]RDC60553.1 Adrenodoxin-like protein, mitochondrial [Alteripontixanthobacter maritimus]